MIDISHHNGTRLCFDKAKADGIIGVIQKATQSESYVDATFRKNREADLTAGLLFGAYHFGDGSDGTLQAKQFLNVVQPDANTVNALDFESNPAGPSMAWRKPVHSLISKLSWVAGRDFTAAMI